MFTVMWLLLSAALVTQLRRVDIDGVRIALSTLRADSSSFVGVRVSVSATVDRVLGPRLFTISDAERAVDTGSLLVLVTAPAIALVRQHTTVKITGTVRLFAPEDLAHHWGWIDEMSSDERNIDTRIMIVADGSTNDEVAAAVSPVITWLGASRSHGGLEAPISDVRALAWSTDTTLVGDAVDLRDVRISAITAASGFWVAAGTEQVFVLTADETHFQGGQHINILGVVLELPASMKNRLGDYDAAKSETVYVYATQVRAL